MMLLLYVINLDTLPMVYNNNYVYYFDTLYIGALPASGYYYTGSVWSIGIVTVNLNCTGSETSVFNCSYNQTGLCLSSRYASVVCQSMLGYSLSISS